MTPPSRFDPSWLVIPAIALMIALGLPRQVPIGATFRTQRAVAAVSTVAAGGPLITSGTTPPVRASTLARPGPTPPSLGIEPAATEPTASSTSAPEAARPASSPAADGGMRVGTPVEGTGSGTGADPFPPAEDPGAPPATLPVVPLVLATPPPDTRTRATPPQATAPQSMPTDALPPGPSPPASRPVWGWPLLGPVAVARSFRAPSHPYGPGHRGVDLRSAPGAPVLAAGAGVVGFAGWIGDRFVVTVIHGELRTTYEPVNPLVRAGQQVAAGATIGHLDAGHPGCPAPACLHWGLLRGSDHLDPLGLFRRQRPRLLPLST